MEEASTADDVVSRLYAVATDGESALLDDLLIRAGARWKCRCGWMNGEQGVCGGCGGYASVCNAAFDT